MLGLPIGIPELIVILIVAVILFGERLPEVTKSFGKTFKEFQRGLRDLKDEISIDPEIKQELEEALYQDVDIESEDYETGEDPEEEELEKIYEEYTREVENEVEAEKDKDKDKNIEEKDQSGSGSKDLEERPE